jgi:hypothetical protein
MEAFQKDTSQFWVYIFELEVFLLKSIVGFFALDFLIVVFQPKILISLVIIAQMYV